LWLNWWAVAIGLKTLTSDWTIHIACIGDDVEEIIKIFHPPGCSQVISGKDFKKRIYYTKFTAVRNAFLAEMKDFLLIDIDALLVRYVYVSRL
jgi:hypothetical protein